MTLTPDLPLLARAREHGGRTALVVGDDAFTYAELLDPSERVAASRDRGGKRCWGWPGRSCCWSWSRSSGS